MDSIPSTTNKHLYTLPLHIDVYPFYPAFSLKFRYKQARIEREKKGRERERKEERKCNGPIETSALF